MEKITLTKKEFKEVIEILNRAATDDTRPILQGLNFNSSEVVALNGYNLSIRKFNFKLDGSYTIHAKDLKEIKKLMSADIYMVEIAFDDENVNFALHSINQTCIEKNFELLQGNYIGYRSLIPRDFNEKIYINDNKKMLDTIKPLKKDKAILLNFAEEKLNLYEVVRVEKGYKEFSHEYNLLGSVKLEKKISEEVKIAMNSTNLKVAIKDYKVGLTISFNKNTEPVIIESENKYDMVLPMRVLA